MSDSEKGHFHLRLLGVVNTWDLSTGRAVLSSRGQEWVFYEWRGTAFELPEITGGPWVSPDGRRLAWVVQNRVGFRSRRIWSWDTVSGGGLIGWDNGPFAFPPDGQLVVGGADSVTFCGESPARRLALAGVAGSISEIGVSPDGRRLACASADRGQLKEVGVWDAVTGGKLVGIHPDVESVSGLMFSPDGAFLVATEAKTATVVWQAANGAEFRVLPYCRKVAFSQDSHLLAGLTSDTTVAVWDVLTGQEVGNCSTFSIKVTAMAFDATGKRLAMGCQDGSVKVWNLP
jgi:WD40 repeat protein